MNEAFLVYFTSFLHIQPSLLHPQLSGSSLTSLSPRRCVPPQAAMLHWQREAWTWRQPSSLTQARCRPAAWWRVMICRDHREAWGLLCHPKKNLKAALTPSTPETDTLWRRGGEKYSLVPLRDCRYRTKGLVGRERRCFQVFIVWHNTWYYRIHQVCFILSTGPGKWLKCLPWEKTVHKYALTFHELHGFLFKCLSCL